MGMTYHMSEVGYLMINVDKSTEVKYNPTNKLVIITMRDHVVVLDKDELKEVLNIIENDID